MRRLAQAGEHHLACLDAREPHRRARRLAGDPGLHRLLEHRRDLRADVGLVAVTRDERRHRLAPLAHAFGAGRLPEQLAQRLVGNGRVGTDDLQRCRVVAAVDGRAGIGEDLLAPPDVLLGARHALALELLPHFVGGACLVTVLGRPAHGARESRDEQRQRPPGSARNAPDD